MRWKDHSDIELVKVEGSGDLRANEPATDDQRLFPLGGFAPRSQVVIEIAVIADPVEIASWDGQRLGAAASRQQELFVAKASPAGLCDCLSLGIEGDDLDARH